MTPPSESAATGPAFDPRTVDLEAFYDELRALRREVDASLGERDLAHLRKLERWGRAATALGLATCWIAPNPASAALLSLGRSTRWLMMHHVGHRGYDRVPGAPPRYTSKVFARGARRFLDWPDWMLPEAWIYEHNVLHHSHTGEARDPDLIERNAESLRTSSLPLPLRHALLGLLAVSWRASYYAPNTLRVWTNRHATNAARAAAARADDDEGDDPAASAPAAPPEEPPAPARALWLTCYLPYAALNFAALPLLFAPLGAWAVGSALANSLGAEALTNLHTFVVVGPNHTGEDLYRFDDRPRSRAEHALRQVIGSTNYRTGGDLLDYAHLWLNYQIEHHLWPDLPMLRYRELAPRVKAICEKHGVPYVQEGVFTRLRKMVDVAVGRASMRRFSPAGA